MVPRSDVMMRLSGLTIREFGTVVERRREPRVEHHQTDEQDARHASSFVCFTMLNRAERNICPAGGHDISLKLRLVRRACKFVGSNCSPVASVTRSESSCQYTRVEMCFQL